MARVKDSKAAVISALSSAHKTAETNIITAQNKLFTDPSYNLMSWVC